MPTMPENLNGWVTIYEGPGAFEDEEPRTVKLSLLYQEGRVTRVDLSPGSAILDDLLEGLLNDRGLEVGEWSGAAGEESITAPVEERGDRLEFAPTLFQWTEFSEWRWVSRYGQEFDHQDPEVDNDAICGMCDRVAYESTVTGSSNNHRTIAHEVLIGDTEGVEKMRQYLTTLKIEFEEVQLTPEHSPCFVIDDAGCGANAFWQGNYWRWEGQG